MQNKGVLRWRLGLQLGWKKRGFTKHKTNNREVMNIVILRLLRAFLQSKFRSIWRQFLHTCKFLPRGVRGWTTLPRICHRCNSNKFQIQLVGHLPNFLMWTKTIDNFTPSINVGFWIYIFFPEQPHHRQNHVDLTYCRHSKLRFTAIHHVNGII